MLRSSCFNSCINSRLNSALKLSALQQLLFRNRTVIHAVSSIEPSLDPEQPVQLLGRYIVMEIVIHLDGWGP